MKNKNIRKKVKDTFNTKAQEHTREMTPRMEKYVYVCKFKFTIL